ncbi:MAG: hypothetical protein K1060chlam1_00164 [Candidatus Anoxychlamydiales bacterium]|nr:hypothetical protein [Candidatus Anoxychlamydiales bacterium]
MKKTIIFKRFLEYFDKDKKLIKYLTDVEIANLNTLPSFAKIKESRFSKESLIDSVHYSWFIPMLNIYSNKEASLFLLAMKKQNKKALQNILGLEDTQNDLSKSIKSFLKEQLLRSLIKKEDHLLPINFLFDAKLNKLLLLSKNSLVKLIDFLGMYDLAKELKFIVEKKKLKTIYSYLKEDEKKILKKILHYKEPFSTKRINIEKYSYDKKKLRNAFHRCGLLRLSYALSLESIDLIWYVCHTLDIGRGNYIFKESRAKKQKEASDIIALEILKIINIIEEKL